MDELNKKFYKIGEVATLLELPQSTLRFWESKFSILRPRRNDRGTRFYTPADIERLRMVKFLLHEKGLKIEAAVEQINHNHSNISRRFEVIERLRAIRSTLSDILDALEPPR